MQAFFYTAHNLLLTPLPFQFYFLAQFFLFPFSTILLFSLLNVFIPLLHLHLLIYSIYFSIHKYIDLLATLHPPHIDPSSTPNRPHIDYQTICYSPLVAKSAGFLAAKKDYSLALSCFVSIFLTNQLDFSKTIIPLALMASASTAHSA